MSYIIVLFSLIQPNIHFSSNTQKLNIPENWLYKVGSIVRLS